MVAFDEKTLPWVDRGDFPAELTRRRDSGQLTSQDADALESWSRDGILHLPQAVSHNQIDALLAFYEQAWSDPPPDVKVMAEGKGVMPWNELGQRSALPNHHFRVMDFQDRSLEARDLMLHPDIMSVLRLILEDTPVAMQSLFFEYGSEQHPHQDFPYVQANIPSHLVGVWFACEDAGPDNGALLYYPGSHRIPKFVFPGTGLLWDGVNPEHVGAFEQYLPCACARMGLEPILFEAKKGDVLFWHAALVHAGSPVGKPGSTRRSFVVHYSSARAYPRDRRCPSMKPRKLERNGGMLYLPR